jgi:hypothetical protein
VARRVAVTLIGISPGPGAGIGTSFICSGLPKACTIAAFIIVAIGVSPPPNCCRFRLAAGRNGGLIEVKPASEMTRPTSEPQPPPAGLTQIKAEPAIR